MNFCLMVFFIFYNIAKSDIMTKNTRLNVETDRNLKSEDNTIVNNEENKIDEIKSNKNDKNFALEKKVTLNNVDDNNSDVGIIQSKGIILIDNNEEEQNKDKTTNINSSTDILKNKSYDTHLNNSLNSKINKTDLNKHLEPVFKENLLNTEYVSENSLLSSPKKRNSYDDEFSSTYNMQNINNDVSLCDPNFKNKYFGIYDHVEPVSPLVASKTMKNKCRNMKNSCCSEKEMLQLFDMIGKETYSVKKMRDKLKKFIYSLKSVSDTSIDNMRYENYDKCTKHYVGDIKAVIKNLRNQADMLYEHFNNQLLNGIFSMFEFVCGMCDHANNAYFKFKQKDKDKFKTEIVIKAGKEKLNFFKAQYEFYKYKDFLRVLIFMKCYFNDFNAIDEGNMLLADDQFRSDIEQSNISGITSNKYSQKYFDILYLPGHFNWVNFDYFEDIMNNVILNTPNSSQEYMNFVTNVTFDYNPSDDSYVISPSNMKTNERRKGYDSSLAEFTDESYIKEFKEVLQIKGSSLPNLIIYLLVVVLIY